MNNDPISDCFEDCVIGDCNRFAYVVAFFVINKPENKLTNPLLISGSLGQGKTHLLKAMEKALINKFPDKKVKYVTADDFTSEYLACIQYNRFEDFRNKYSTADFLLFDDVDHLKNKTGVQIGFYNTIVPLLDSGRNIVVATKENPYMLGEIFNPTLSDRLISGAVIEIELPDIEIKREITADFIIDTAANYFGCSRQRILTGPNSYKRNYQRLVSVAVCEDLLDLSSVRLESFFGLILSRENIVKLTVGDSDFEKDVEAIKEELISWRNGVD